MAQTKEAWVAMWRASGLSGTAFARRHGLKESTLYAWGRQRAAGGTFVEVKLPDVGAVREATGEIEIEVGKGRVVRVRGDVDRELLRLVLEVLERC